MSQTSLKRSEHWPLVQVGDVADLLRGVSYSKEDATYEPLPTHIPVLRATNIQDAQLVLDSDMVYIAKHNVSDVQRLRAGDIVLATSSGSKHLVGKSALLRHSWGGSFGAFCAALRPKASIDARYLAAYLQSPAYWKEIRKKALGVNINNLRRADLETLTFQLPPRDEQETIVAEIEKQFSRLDEAIANLKRVKANLNRYKAAVLKAAVEGRLVPTEAELARKEGRNYETGSKLLQRILDSRRRLWKSRGKFKESTILDTSELSELPDGWDWASVDQLASHEPYSITDGPFGSNLKSSHYQESGPRVIRLQNIKDGEFADEYAHISVEHFETLRKHAVYEGDLVIASLGENPPRACIIPPLVGLAIVKADCIRFSPHSALSAEYLNAALNSQPTRQRMKDVLHGIGRPRLSLGEIRAIALPIPPAPEQKRIAAEVARCATLIREIEAQVDSNLKRSQRLRSSILAEAFTHA